VARSVRPAAHMAALGSLSPALRELNRCARRLAGPEGRKLWATIAGYCMHSSGHSFAGKRRCKRTSRSSRILDPPRRNSNHSSLACSRQRDQPPANEPSRDLPTPRSSITLGGRSFANHRRTSRRIRFYLLSDGPVEAERTIRALLRPRSTPAPREAFLIFMSAVSADRNISWRSADNRAARTPMPFPSTMQREGLLLCTFSWVGARNCVDAKIPFPQLRAVSKYARPTHEKSMSYSLRANRRHSSIP